MSETKTLGQAIVDRVLFLDQIAAHIDHQYKTISALKSQISELESECGALKEHLIGDYYRYLLPAERAEFIQCALSGKGKLLARLKTNARARKRSKEQGRKQNWSNELHRDLIVDHHKKGDTVDEIAKKLEISSHIVRSTLKKLNVPRMSAQHIEIAQTYLSEESLSLEAVGKKYNKSRQAVHCIVKRYKNLQAIGGGE